MSRVARFLAGFLAAGILSAALVPATARGHAVVHPNLTRPGAYQKYVLRVPNEREVPTLRVELTFPEGVRVASFGEVQGWALEVVTDEAGRVERAIWTGELPAMRFVEFPFVAVNPRAEATLAWPVTQTYAGGEVVEWAGPEDSETPVSVTRVTADGGDFPWTEWAAGAALLAAILALGLALRPVRTSPTA
jgi:uncharacterized protein YcnI